MRAPISHPAGGRLRPRERLVRCVRGAITSGFGAIAIGAMVGLAAGAEPSATGRKTLPTLGGGAGEEARVQGEIHHSTRDRGHGAVRLDVVADSGEHVAVLLVPDATLDALGLSYRVGERIDARGAMVPGKRTLLVASEVTTADGKAVRLRGGGAEPTPSPQPAPEPTGSP